MKTILAIVLFPSPKVESKSSHRYFSSIRILSDQFKKVCDKFCNSPSEELRQNAEDDLQHVITCIQFANDECDYGEGLEFGLNLFLYGLSKLHSRIQNLLPLGYKLLYRNLYAQIINDHLSSGRSKLIEELNEIHEKKQLKRIFVHVDYLFIVQENFSIFIIIELMLIRL